MAKLVTVEGIGESYAQRLEEAGIKTTDDLLELGASAQGRMEIAERTDISVRLILNWVNRAEVLRIRGVGEEFADLLEAGGIDTVRELAQRNPENLYRKLARVNQEQWLVRRLPSPEQVEDWVEQARALPRVVTY
jgi:predicted flap endonuclease-1-like 5' DNA nuclease